eukprot:scaffold24839_cov58-Phaeocystis_antarctica.AAC.2
MAARDPVFRPGRPRDTQRVRDGDTGTSPRSKFHALVKETRAKVFVAPTDGDTSNVDISLEPRDIT